MNRHFIRATGALLTAAILSAPAIAEIRIGVAGPMTGQYAAFGKQMRRGVDMAIQEINASGGVNGEKLALLIVDDRCDPRQAAKAADKMVVEKPVLVIGHFCGGASIAASPVYAREKIIQIAPATTNPVFTERRPGPGVFRLTHSDRKQAEFAAALISAKYSGKKVAILGDDSIFGSSLAAAVRHKLEVAGQKPALNESYSPEQKDYSALVEKMKAAGIEVVYAGGYHTEIGRIVREMRKRRLAAQLITSDALATREFWNIAGRAGEGTLMTSAADPRKNASAAPIVKKFRAKGWNLMATRWPAIRR